MNLKPLPLIADTIKSVSDNTVEDFFNTNNGGLNPIKL
mgnify:CR=1 FL=1